MQRQSAALVWPPRKPVVRSWQKPEVSDTGKTIFPWRAGARFNQHVGVIAAETNQNRSSRQNETTESKAFPASLPAFVLGGPGAGIHRSGCGEKSESRRRSLQLRSSLCPCVEIFRADELEERLGKAGEGSQGRRAAHRLRHDDLRGRFQEFFSESLSRDQALVRRWPWRRDRAKTHAGKAGRKIYRGYLHRRHAQRLRAVLSQQSVGSDCARAHSAGSIGRVQMVARQTPVHRSG